MRRPAASYTAHHRQRHDQLKPILPGQPSTANRIVQALHLSEYDKDRFWKIKNDI
jgi:hypothetical protein